MIKLFLVATILFFASINCFAQTDTAKQKFSSSTANKDDADYFFSEVEKEASFPGGEDGWRNFLQNNLNPDVPVKAKAPAGKYTVVIKFIVSKDGSIKDISAETNFGYGMEEEVIRVIKEGPKWIPGERDGRKVNSYRRQPVTFQVDEK